jgi:hypothetical protein
MKNSTGKTKLSTAVFSLASGILSPHWPSAQDAITNNRRSRPR